MVYHSVAELCLDPEACRHQSFRARFERAQPWHPVSIWVFPTVFVFDLAWIVMMDARVIEDPKI